MTTQVGQVVESARRSITQLTGQPVASVVSCAPSPDGCWRVVLETLERKAVPDSGDLLASYELLLDQGGGTTTFRRIRMRRRGEPGQEE